MSERIGEAERRERPEGEGLAEGENPTDKITVLRNRNRNFGRAGRKFRSFLNVSASKAGGFEVNFVENASKVASS